MVKTYRAMVGVRVCTSAETTWFVGDGEGSGVHTSIDDSVVGGADREHHEKGSGHK